MSTQPLRVFQNSGFDTEHRMAGQRLDYRLRVRGSRYLWGSHGIKENLSFKDPLVLHIRNDTFGEPVTIITEKADGHKTTIGKLKAGEHVSLQLEELSGVLAKCALETTVGCALRR